MRGRVAVCHGELPSVCSNEPVHLSMARLHRQALLHRPLVRNAHQTAKLRALHESALDIFIGFLPSASSARPARARSPSNAWCRWHEARSSEDLALFRSDPSGRACCRVSTSARSALGDGGASVCECAWCCVVHRGVAQRWTAEGAEVRCADRVLPGQIHAHWSRCPQRSLRHPRLKCCRAVRR